MLIISTVSHTYQVLHICFYSYFGDGFWDMICPLKSELPEHAMVNTLQREEILAHEDRDSNKECVYDAKGKVSEFRG